MNTYASKYSISLFVKRNTLNQSCNVKVPQDLKKETCSIKNTICVMNNKY